MKAAVVLRPNVISIQEIPTPEAGPDDIVIRVHACGVCGSTSTASRATIFWLPFPGCWDTNFPGSWPISAGT